VSDDSSVRADPPRQIRLSHGGEDFEVSDPQRLNSLDEHLGWERIRDLRTDRSLRKGQAAFIGRVLIAQLLITNIVFVCVGFGWLSYDPVSLRIFLGATTAEIVGLALVVTRYLFPARDRR
jgi:hypothetical protein